MASEKKTYFLVPTWDYPVDGPIALGNIVTDPRNPSETLLSSSSSIPQTVSSSKSAVEVFRGRSNEGKVGLWAQFLEVIGFGGKMGITWRNDFGNTYKVDTLDTTFFELTPSDIEYVTQRVQDQRVQIVLNAGRRGKSVYIITGIKAARGFALSSEIFRSRRILGKLGFSGNAAGSPVSGGPEVEGSSTKMKTDSFGGSTDIVFAYRVREIFQKTENGVTFTGHKEHNKGAFLNAEDRKSGREGPIKVDFGDRDTTTGDLDEGTSMKYIVVEEDGESCGCLFA